MMADQRTMAQLLQAPTEGYEDAIVVPAITADNFELKHGLLTLVQDKQFFGHDKEDPHAHIRYFNKITSTLKFLNRFDESFSEAWDRFKDLLRACPHHGFSKLHQLDTFYNALNSKDQDLLNSAAGGNFLDKMPRECLAIIKSKSKVHYSRNKPVVAKVSMYTSTSGISPDVAELKYMVKGLLLDKKSQNQAPATVKAVEESCVTCGGAHSYRNCPATDGNVYRDNIQEFVSQAFAVNYNQGNTSYRPTMMSNQIRPPGFPSVLNNQNVQLNQRNNQNCFNQNQNRGNNFNHGPVYQPLVFQPPAYQAPVYQAPAPQTQSVSKEDFLAYVKASNAVMRNMQTQGQNMQNQLTNLTELLTKFVNSNNASTSSSSTLPRNTIANPRSDLKAITTRKATKDTVHPTNSGSVEEVQPPVLQSESLILTSEPVNSPIIEPVTSPVSVARPNQRPSIPYPSRMQDQKLRDKANDQRENFFQIFKDLNFNIIFADALILMSKFGQSIKSLLTNKDKLCELARTPLNEHCSAILLKKLPENLGDPGKFLIPCDFPGKAECLALADLGASINLMPFSMWNKLSLPDLTPKCMTLDLADRSISCPVRVAEDVYVKVGELTLRVGKEAITFNLDQTSRYSANYSEMTAKRIDVIDMACEEHSQEVLGFSDVIVSGNPTPYYDPIVSTTSSTLTPFGNSDFLIEEVDAFLAIEDDPTSPEELKICEAKYDKSSIDEPPEVELKDLPPRLEFTFLEGDDKLIVIIVKDLSVEEKTAHIMVLKSYKRAIAWKLSDIKGIDPEFCTHKILMEEDFEPAVQHQRRVNPKIHDVIKQEVLKLLDVGLIYPIYDSPWVSPVHCVPKKVGFTVVENEDNELIPTRLVTGWRVCIDYHQEKTTFTCPYGTFAYRHIPSGLCNVPGTFQRYIMAIFHDMIEKTMEVFMDDFLVFGNSFQSCHSHLERMLKRCIKDFSKTARPMTRLLEKDTPFHFSKECVEAFQTLKKKPTEAPILISPDWDMPFELMCDSNDFAIGAVLGLHDSKIKDCVFNIDDRVLLFNSRMKIFSGKLKSRWSGLFTISYVYPYGTVELAQPDGLNFKVNGHRLKHYFGEDVPKLVVPNLQTFLKDH
nr:reverse transcriptase domain-containing protein [Tanacetum cinerariifolium]